MHENKDDVMPAVVRHVNRMLRHSHMIQESSYHSCSEYLDELSFIVHNLYSEPSLVRVGKSETKSVSEKKPAAPESRGLVLNVSLQDITLDQWLLKQCMDLPPDTHASSTQACMRLLAESPEGQELTMIAFWGVLRTSASPYYIIQGDTFDSGKRWYIINRSDWSSWTALPVLEQVSQSPPSPSTRLAGDISLDGLDNVLTIVSRITSEGFARPKVGATDLSQLDHWDLPTTGNEFELQSSLSSSLVRLTSKAWPGAVSVATSTTSSRNISCYYGYGLPGNLQ